MTNNRSTYFPHFPAVWGHWLGDVGCNSPKEDLKMVVALFSCDAEACGGQNYGVNISLALEIPKSQTFWHFAKSCFQFSSEVSIRISVGSLWHSFQILVKHGHPDHLRPQTRFFPVSLTSALTCSICRRLWLGGQYLVGLGLPAQSQTTSPHSNLAPLGVSMHSQFRVLGFF